MSHRYIGGLITKTPVTPTAQAAPGVWTLEQALQYIKAGTWPVPQLGDPYWQNTNLLLGTNGVNTSQNNTFLDSSNNTYSVTRSGNPTQGTFTPLSVPNGYWGNYFDGSGDYLSVADAAAFTLGTSDFCVESWIFPTNASAGASESIIGQWSSASYGWIFQYRSGTLLMYYSTNGSSISNAINVSVTISNNIWTHIAFVRSGNTLSAYVNGTRVSTNSSFTASIVNSSSAVNVGRNGDNSEYVTGFLSNTRVVVGSSVYDPTQTSITVPTTPLTAITNTSLLTCQSNYFKDNSTNGFPISISGTPKVLPFAPFGNPSGYRANTVSGSGYFDGSGDLLNTGYTGFFGTGDYTISFWIYMDAYVSPDNNGADGGFVYIYNQGASHPTYPLGVTISKAGKVVVVDSVNFGPTWESTFDFAGSYNTANSAKLGQWNYVHLYRQSGTLYIYCNGGLQLSVSQASALAAPVTNGTIIPQGYCQGYLTDFRLVTSAITDPTPPTAPLTAVTNTQLLLNFTNAGLYDLAAKNDFETVGDAKVSTSVVKYGAGSLALDGSGDWLAGPPTPQTDLGSGDFTIEAWLYRTASGAASDSGIVSRGAPSTLNGFMFGYTSANLLTFNFNYAGPIVTASAAIPINSWTHVAVCRVGNVFNLFMNGLLVGSATSTNSQTLNAADVVYIGRSGYDSSRIVTGYVSDVRITKGFARYPYSFTPPTAALPSYYQAITPLADPYFEYTTLLLPGNGTNGAQNNTFLDSSANTFSITRNGNTTQGTFSPFSQTGWSNYFDGSGDSFSVPANSAWNLGSGAFTIECWSYPTTTQSDKHLFSLNSSGGTGFWVLRYDTGTVPQFIYNGYSVSLTSSTAAALNQWNHIAMVSNGSTMSLYLNGVRVATASASAINDGSANPLYIGSQYNVNRDITGYLSNARIVKGTAVYDPSQTTISVPNQPLTAVTNTVLLLCQSNRFVDNSASPFTITVNGNPSVQAFSPFNPTASYSTSTVGGSGYWDGSGDSLQTTVTGFGSGDFTIEGWYYNSSTSSEYAYLFTFGDSATSTGLELYRSASNFYLYNNAGIAISATGLPKGQWINFAVTRSSNTVTLYINGTSQGTATISATIDNTLRLGVEYYSGSVTGTLTGYLSDFRVRSVSSTPSLPTTPLTSIANTLFLCNFTNAGITDATAKNDLETVGNAQISTTQSKFGGSSMYFDGTGDRLQIPDSPGLRIGTGDFTIEGWFYTTTLSGVRSIFYKSQTDTNGVVFVINNSSAGSANLYAGTGSGSWSLTLDAPSAIAVNTWTHLAAVRYGNTWMIFSNGNLLASATNSVSASNTTEPATIGYFRSANPFDWSGYMQDVRITKGIARYTQNFTPPATAFLTL